MKKKLLLTFSLSISVIALYAQVGIGTTTPNAHAVLELKSPGNNQGLLISTYTTAQRTASAFTSLLGAMENGLLVYDSDLTTFFYWTGTQWQPILNGAVTGAGTVTSVSTGTGLTGGPITTTGTVALANTAVTPATYGDATHVSQFAVDAQGRITNASSVSITGVTPAGVAGGDLSGSFPNPGVAKIQGSAVSAAAPAANQILKWNGTSWTPAADANSGGTVTSLATGTGLSGGPVTTTGTIALSNTAVTPATYGDATHTSQIAVDAQGRITNASNVLITGAAPTGTAGGDLSGNFPNPGVAKIQGSAVSAAAPGANQILKWNGTSWTPSADANSGGTVTSLATGTGLSGGPVTATGTIALSNTAVTPATYGDATHTSQFAVDAQGRITNASNVLITGAAPTGAAGGDLSGSFPNPGVAKIQGSAVSATAPTANQILKWNGTSWTPSADANSGGTVTSVAGGTGLSGGPITGTGTLSLANTAVTAATYGDGTHVPQVAVDAQGRITTASNVLIAGAAPTGAAGGDLSGTFPNPGVAKIQGSAVSVTAPTANQILKWNGTSWTPSTDANSGGTVTSVAGGTGLTGGPITGTGTLSLSSTGVTAGTYGSATQVPQIVVDAQGRLTSVTNTAVNALTLPYNGSVSYATSGAFAVSNTSTSTSASGIIAFSSGADGIFAVGPNSGVYGEHPGGNYGFVGTANYGVFGLNATSTHWGTLGDPNAGVYGQANTNVGTAVYGSNLSTTRPSIGYLGGTTYGIYGEHENIAVFGKNNNTLESGLLGGNGYGVYSNGPSGGTGTWQVVSDRRFKKNINRLDNSLAQVVRLRGVSYDFRFEEFPDRRFARQHQIGLIAQEVKEILPEVVSQGSDGYYSVSYEKVVPVLIEAIKEQQKLIEAQSQRLAEIEALLRSNQGDRKLALKKSN